MAFNPQTEVTGKTYSRDHRRTLLSYVVVGDNEVGKSSIVKRFIENEFSDSCPTKLMGCDWSEIVLDENIIQLIIFDFAGRESWRSSRENLYRRSNGMIIVYDVTDRESFDSVERRVKQLNTYGNAVKYLVGNKCDLKDNRVVTYLEGKELADKLGIYFLETSAKDGTNVEQLFISLASAIVNQERSTLSDNISHNQRRLACCCKIS